MNNLTWKARNQNLTNFDLKKWLILDKKNGFEWQDISAAELDLVQITSETAEAHNKANESVLESESFRERLKELKHKLIKNEHDFKGVERDLEIATALAQSASHGANEVDVRYKSVLLTLDKTTTFGESIRDRSLRLQDKANRLSATATAKAQEFEGFYALFGSSLV